MLNSRHWAILTYGGLIGMAIFKGYVNDAQEIIAACAPIAGIFIWDKLEARKLKTE